jgi:hypothetical protein
MPNIQQRLPACWAAEEVECATLDLENPLQKALFLHMKKCRLRLLAWQTVASGDAA